MPQIIIYIALALSSPTGLVQDLGFDNLTDNAYCQLVEHDADQKDKDNNNTDSIASNNAAILTFVGYTQVYEKSSPRLTNTHSGTYLIRAPPTLIS